MNTITELLEAQIPQEPDPHTGLPIGPAMLNTQAAKMPGRVVLQGRYCRLEPLDAVRHCSGLYQASTPADAMQRFQYLMEKPPGSLKDMSAWITHTMDSSDPLFFAVINEQTGHVEGRQSFLRITPAQQSIEIGNIYWGPNIAGTQVATEANFLFAQYVFESLGYRRYEWKCNALNGPSRRAALRFGFTYEGHFRRAVIVHGRSRDTSWFSIIDEEWPALKEAYEQWLDPDNFHENGQQKTHLSELTRIALS
ncbi:MAG: GNAT family protein [Granulosicoccus sp.]